MKSMSVSFGFKENDVCEKMGFRIISCLGYEVDFLMWDFVDVSSWLAGGMST